MHSNSPSSSPSLIRIAFPVIVSLTVALPSPIAKISHDLWSESKSGLPDPLTRLARTEDPSSSSSSFVSSSAGDDGGADSDAYAAGNGDLWKDVGWWFLLAEVASPPFVINHRTIVAIRPPLISIIESISVISGPCIRAGLMVISGHPVINHAPRGGRGTRRFSGPLSRPPSLSLFLCVSVSSCVVPRIGEFSM